MNAPERESALQTMAYSGWAFSPERNRLSCGPGDGSGPAGALITEFEEKFVELEVPSAREYGQACGQFFDAVVDSKEIRHIGQPMLDEAVKAAVRRDLGEAWAWSRRNTDFDICPLVAVTWAAWGHAKYSTVGEVNAYVV